MHLPVAEGGDRDGLVLATQPSAAMSMPLKGEFPGGKIDPGEIILHEHAAIAWLTPEKLHALEWAEAYVLVLASYLAEIKPGVIPE